jgi:hypothetical protein
MRESMRSFLFEEVAGDVVQAFKDGLKGPLGKDLSDEEAKEIAQSIADKATSGVKEEPAPEGESTSLRSMLFQKKSNKKRTKLDPKASNVKTALDDLSQAWQTYNSDPKKLGGKDQADLMKKLAAAQDALKGVKLEGKLNDEDVIVERWQRMAGIL